MNTLIIQKTQFKNLLRTVFLSDSEFWCPVILVDLILDYVGNDFIPIWITKLVKCASYPSNYLILWAYLKFESYLHHLPFLILYAHVNCSILNQIPLYNIQNEKILYDYFRYYAKQYSPFYAKIHLSTFNPFACSVKRQYQRMNLPFTLTEESWNRFVSEPVMLWNAITCTKYSATLKNQFGEFLFVHLKLVPFN